MTIRTVDHLDVIQALLVRYSLDPSILEIVDDVAARSTELGYHDRNPFRLARSIRTPGGKSFILISAEITDDMIASAKSAMSHRGFTDEVQLLSTGDLLLRHLVLHEVAAFVLGTCEQEERDRWAFQELERSGGHASLQQAKELPCNWLKFWVWWRLPLSALAVVSSPLSRLTSTSGQIDPAEQLAALITFLLTLPIAALLIALAVGLHRRRIWAWRANWILVFGEAILWPLDYIQNGGAGTDSISLFPGLVVLAIVVWALPNFFYFRKRRDLFH